MEENAIKFLRNLNFTNLYLMIGRINEATDLYEKPHHSERLQFASLSLVSPKQMRDKKLPTILPLDSAYYDDAINFSIEVENAIVFNDLDGFKRDSALEYDGIRYRLAAIRGLEGQLWVALRRFNTELPMLDNLNFHPYYLKALKSINPNSGLVVIGGATAAGKTTTTVAILNHFLRTYGKLAYTIEDPAEYFMQGPVGNNNGYCVQYEVKKEEDWALGLQGALRFTPKYIFLGEIRTPDAAKYLLRAATSGHLALCTVHGGSIQETLSGIVQIASSSLGELGASLLADGLNCVVHQRIENGAPIVDTLFVDSNQNLEMDSLKIPRLNIGKDESNGIKELIRANNMKLLPAKIENQKKIIPLKEKWSFS